MGTIEILRAKIQGPANAQCVRRSSTLAGLVAALFISACSLSAAEPVLLERIELIPRFKITGPVGALFRIEYNDDLSHPDQWATLQNLVLPSSPFLFIDTNAPSKAARIYRIASQSQPPAVVWIDPGKFSLGSPVTEQDRFEDEGPQTTVTISKGFWIGKYEVTQVEYLTVMGINPSSFSGDLNRPVESVSWNEATNFCARLTEQERREGRLPTGHAYRLPTEAEWEYTARAGTSVRFCYGDDPGYVQLSSYAWFGSNSEDSTHPVGAKAPNPWGLHDMHGNVWEWCSDWYVGAYPGGNRVDLLGPTLPILSHADRVIRGGSWKGLSRFCRSASRSSGDPSVPNSNVGFRVVLAPVRAL